MVDKDQTNAQLDALIEAARKLGMSVTDKRKQAASFVYGNCHIDNPSVTREKVEEARARIDDEKGKHGE